MLAILTVGIPACGKSTYARQFLARGWVEINRDELRLELGGAPGVPRVEAAVTRISRERMAAAARSGRDLVVSDTNVTRRGRKDLCKFLRKLGYGRIEAHVFEVPLDVCLERNRKRRDAVPERVLLEMAVRLGRQPVWLTDGFDVVVLVVV